MVSRQRLWQIRNPDKARAQKETFAAIEAARIARRPCERCGDADTQAHHDDYGRPLDVRWLCRACHRELHVEMRGLATKVRTGRQHPIATVLRAEGRTQAWLARTTKYTASYVNRVLHGHVPATGKFRRTCARALGVPESELFHDDSASSEKAA